MITATDAATDVSIVGKIDFANSFHVYRPRANCFSISAYC
jgi:hypothetical protein